MFHYNRFRMKWRSETTIVKQELPLKILVAVREIVVEKTTAKGYSDGLSGGYLSATN